MGREVVAVCGPQEQHCFKTYYKVGPKKGGGQKISYDSIYITEQNEGKQKLVRDTCLTKSCYLHNTIN